MSHNNDLLATRPRKQRSLLLAEPASQRAGPSTWIWHPRSTNSTSLPHGYLSQIDLDNDPDPLDDISLDSDLDQRTASSATLLSRRVSSSLSTSLLLSDASCASPTLDPPTQLPESRQFIYPLHEPGQRTAQRIRRLRTRTAAVIKSLPATSEEVGDADDHETHKVAKVVPAAQAPKLRRVAGVRDLRRAFRDGDHHEPVHFASNTSLGISKASYELGFLAGPIAPLSPISPHSSLRTLVELGHVRPQSSGDLKTLCQSTFSSLSIASRSVIKLHSTLPLMRPSHTRSPSDASQSMFPKHLVYSSLTLRPRRTSLQLDNPPSRSPGVAVWSCAKISQSAIKRTARRGHTPRRVFSSPIAALSS